jgi:hypothetical protein
LRGKSWVASSPDGNEELPDAPTNLATWSVRFKESDTLPPPVKFQTDPESLTDSPQPRDFAVIDTGARSIGADPNQVGPSAREKK